MYICKDCGAKYAKKVEYCDCGNNTFDYIEDKFVAKKKAEKPQKQPMTVEQKGELLSRIFLIFCILLSAIVWLIPVKVDNTKQNGATEIKIQDTKNIPPIDSFWDNTPVYVEKKAEPEPVVINETPIPLNAVPDYAKPKPVEQKKVVQQQKTKVELKKVQSSTQKTQTSAQKPATQKQSAQPLQKTQPKQEQKQVTPKQTSAPSPKLYEPVTPKTTSQPKTEPQKPAYNPNSPEMLQYKGSLRAAMFSKFAVGSIQGSGNCSVRFSIDSTGKLINRAFVKQSDNKSLNDAVYYMLMSVPRFAVPPSGYNGETIQMNFSINNGSYEISIY